MAEENAQQQNWRVAKMLITVWVGLFVFGLYLMIFR